MLIDFLTYKRSAGALRESCDVLWTKGGHIMVFPVASWLFIVVNAGSDVLDG